VGAGVADWEALPLLERLGSGVLDAEGEGGSDAVGGGEREGAAETEALGEAASVGGGEGEARGEALALGERLAAPGVAEGLPLVESERRSEAEAEAEGGAEGEPSGERDAEGEPVGLASLDAVSAWLAAPLRVRLGEVLLEPEKDGEVVSLCVRRGLPLAERLAGPLREALPLPAGEREALGERDAVVVLQAEGLPPPLRDTLAVPEA
jgi:hypothetical protein